MAQVSAQEFLPEMKVPRTPVIMGWVTVFQFGLLISYVLSTGARITDPLFLLYPFIWINASLLALLRTDRPVGSTSRRIGAGVIAISYFGLLGYFGGLFGVGVEQMPMHLNWGPPPGYGPALMWDTGVVNFILEPFKVIGYLTLAYFVYATVLDAAAGAIPGILGLFSCISCSWPIIGMIATSLFGSSSAVAAFAIGNSYGVGTLVFVSALGLLYYRPLV